MSKQQEIQVIESLIRRWKSMAREYYHKKDFTNASLCRKLRLEAVAEINRLKEEVV